MTKQNIVQQLLPTSTSLDIRSALQQLSAGELALPFAADRMEFIATVAQRLRRSAPGRPELQALAFWMRKAALTKMAQTFAANQQENTVAVPRGTVFHIPPANVDTMFAYSWVLSILAGNRNLVRISHRAIDQSGYILSAFEETLAEYPEVAAGTSVFTYGHDEKITRELTKAADVRVVWGGDSTVNQMRAIPLEPHGRDLSFPDRISMAAIDIESYNSLTDSGRNTLAENFFNDSYWFDQLGCSSPRIVIWIGSSPNQACSADFFSRIFGVANLKGYSPATSTAINKITYSMQAAIDHDIRVHTWQGNTLAVLELNSFRDIRGEFCGAGMFYQLTLPSLIDLSLHVKRADQTLTIFGIPRQDLEEFVKKTRGRGIDRIVPIGQALNFDHIWDGMDLLQEFTRKISIRMKD